MVSALSPLSGQSQQVDLAGALAGGQQAYQRKQLNDQAMQQNQQQISRADYEQGVERLKVINRLALKVKELPNDQRYGFVNSLNQDMLKSVGIDPAQINSVQLDDQSLDALIAQTGAAIPEGSQYRKESVSTNQGLMVFDPQTGTYVAATGSDGKPLSAAQYDPSLQGQIATAKQTGQNVSDLAYKPAIAGAETQAEIDARVASGGAAQEVEALGAGRGRNIAEAESAAGKAEKISGNLIDNIAQARKLLPGATGSGVGAMADAGGRLVGVTTDSAKKAARLDTLAGWMVANVPRMEGPQSNFDVENYKTMAAKVGNREIPVEERMAALDTLEELQKKYSGKNKSMMRTDGKEAAQSVNWNDLP